LISTKLLVTIGAVLVLPGCVTRYALPPDVPKANLNVSTNLNGVRVQVFEDERCTKSPYGNRLAYFFLNVADPHSGVNKAIQADKEFIYTFNLSDGAPGYFMSACTVTLGFLPKANETYKTSFEGRNRECVASISRVVKAADGEHLIPEDTIRQIKPACINNLTD
jgi:hypothetical protein